MAVIQQFRTAIRGFNRQDVQDYVGQMAAAHQQELAELQKKLNKSELRIQDLEETVSGMDAMANELSETRAALDESSQMVSRLRGEMSQAEAKLTVARKKLERLHAQIDALEPLAASYQEIKDRAANVELDAYQKAQATVGEAKEEAERIRAEAREWFSSVMAEYSQMRDGLEGMLEQLQRLSDAPKSVEELEETGKNPQEQADLK